MKKEEEKVLVAAGPKDDETNYAPVGDDTVIEDKPSNKAFIPYKSAFKKVKNINDHFRFERELGSGAFGEVWLAIH